MAKAGFVALIGRPNSGKSTLMNTILGKKIAIVSKMPQTTRNAIRGIYTRGQEQIVFVDTPGIHESVLAYNTLLNKQAKEVLGDADVVLYMVDLSRPFGREEHGIMDLLKKAGKPVVIAFNKTDIKDNRVVENSVNYLELVKDLPHVKDVYISGLRNKNVDELLDILLELMPEHPLLYPEDMVTDQAIEFQVEERIREKVIQLTYEEIPHAVRIEVGHIEEDKEKKLMSIFAEVCVERESQKAVLIGKGGEKVKKIGTEARKELEELFGMKVFLKLQVKVDKKWRNGR